MVKYITEEDTRICILMLSLNFSKFETQQPIIVICLSTLPLGIWNTFQLGNLLVSVST